MSFHLMVTMMADYLMVKLTLPRYLFKGNNDGCLFLSSHLVVTVRGDALLDDNSYSLHLLLKHRRITPVAWLVR